MINGMEVTFGIIILIIALGLWSLIWKGIGLWNAGKRGHMGWFVVILVFNTLGIIPIIYLFLNKKISLD